MVIREPGKEELSKPKDTKVFPMIFLLTPIWKTNPQNILSNMVTIKTGLSNMKIVGK